MLKFSSKAENLEKLTDPLKTANILPQICFCIQDWHKDPKGIVDRVMGRFSSQPLIVRSSVRLEDGLGSSLAGKYKSVLSVLGEHALREAIQSVITSFCSDDASNQVFIQPMLTDISMSGVALSQDIQTRSPYIVINYDEKSSRTDTITSGSAQKSRVFYVHRSHKSRYNIDRNLVLILNLIEELESLYTSNCLDIEFAFSKEQLYLFQVRPLVGDFSHSFILEKEQRESLNRIERILSLFEKRHPYLYGEKSYFAVMPDWNPAEIIGLRPRPLAFSLYAHLITDNTWAYQRDNYGYKNLRSVPLMFSFEGLPYIDVRASFNSFLPKDLDSELSEKILSYYMDRLKQNPEKHDKVEFEILFTAYSFDLPERVRVLLDHGFDTEECEQIIYSLVQLTQRIMNPEKGFLKKDLERITALKPRTNQILNSDLDPFAKIYWLMEYCNRYGTLPFAGLARCGFISIGFLRSLVKKGVFTEENLIKFMNSLSILNRMQKDFSQLEQKEFLQRYGHLRPSTYDILSPRYDASPDKYFDWNRSVSFEDLNSFSISLEQLNQIEELLKQSGFELEALSFLNFLKQSIEGRESSKFIFTQTVSEILSLLGQVGQELGFSLEDLSFLNIREIFPIYSSSASPKELLARSIEKGKKEYEKTKGLVLPSILFVQEDLWAFHIEEGRPNFIGQKKVRGKVVQVESFESDIEDSIVFIPSADPGYDWIFLRGIRALVTMYGGANSHMAIRAAELGIPAVLGVGELLYQKWKKARVLEIDCINQNVLLL